MRHSFAPFGPREVAVLTAVLDVDYSRVDWADPRWLCVAGYDDATDELMGLCAFEFCNPWDASFTIAIRDPRCITRRIMRAMFTAVFSQAVRVSAEIEPDNHHSLALAKRMGFSIEGYKPLAIEGRRDALLLGMTRDTCRWLGRAQRRPQAAVEAIYGQDPASA